MTQQYIHKFHANGHALGSEIVVVCEELSDAESIATRWLRDNGLDPGTLKLETREEFHGGQLVYAWDGDY